jgi:TolB-like protein/Flp pilus assembly protein TadD/tRNA A-37 threonylcarbamoyl transferase component Bud32
MDLLSELQESLGAAYEFERELGSGGMSRVFVARDVALGRRVVFKVLPPELSSVIGAERFRREIALAAQLRHPHIVPLHTAGEADGLLYYTMPFVEGETLRSALNTGGKRSTSDCVRILRDIADALAYAHGCGVVHRDIKPENILLENRHAVVTDFGVAKALTSAARSNAVSPESLTTAGVTLGTVAYMAPEQAAADPATDHRADLYSLGVVAYELLTGAPVFGSRSPHQTVVAHMVETPTDIRERSRDLPPRLADLVMRLLAKQPDDRPQSATEVVDILEAIGTSPTTAEGDGHPFRRTHAPPVGRGAGILDRRSRLAAIAAATIIILVVAGYALTRRSTSRSAVTSTPVDVRSVAVLPFVNTSGDTENEHFTDGLTDELIGALGSVQNLKVAARTSSFALKGKELSVRAIGDTLGVANVLEGSVHRAGDRLRATVQLVSAADGKVLWSEQYNRDTRDVFAVQEEIAKAITSALNVRLSGAETARLAARPTSDLEAYDAYLKGRYEWNRRSRESLQSALAYFKRAAEIDPKFALAYVGTADTYASMANFNFLPASEALSLAEKAVRRAIALDSSLAEAYASKGFILATRATAVESERAFRRALELNPSYPEAHHYYSMLLTALGRAEEALDENGRTLALDPLSLSANANRGVILEAKGDFPGARSALERSLAMRSDFMVGLLHMGILDVAEGRYTEGLTRLRAAKLRAPGFPGIAPAIAYTYARLGQRARSDSVLKELRDGATDNRSRINLAMALAETGDLDGAFAIMQSATWDMTTLIQLHVDPLLAALRKDPRYLQLLAKIGLKA